MSLVDFDIIMVHYHAARLVAAAVSALEDDAHHCGLAIRVFVVDNGSTDEERGILESLKIMRLDPGENLNFPAGVNFAFPYTSAERLVLMNEDVMVLPGCLGILWNELQNGPAVVGPEFYWDRDRIFTLPCTEERTRGNELAKAAGRRSVRALKRARDRWREHARRHWRTTTPMPTLAISGALMAFHRGTWEAAGPFGGGYRMYFDENDWLLRIERAGLRSVFVPEAKAIHLHNPNLAGHSDRVQWAEESFLEFGNRYYGERFMQRLFLIARRPPVFPEWQPLPVEADGATIEVEIPATPSWPVWIELTPSPSGYPAAAARIFDPATKRWRLPPLKGLPFLTGPLFLQVVDDAGRELGSYTFQRHAADLPTAAW